MKKQKLTLAALEKMSDEVLTKTIIELAEPYAQKAVEVGYAVGPEMDEEKVRELTDRHRQLVLENEPTDEFEPKCKTFMVFDSPMAAIKAVPGLTPGNAMYGQHDVSWLYNYLLYRNEFGLVTETEEITALVELASMIGWFWLGRDATVVTRRPAEIHLLTKHTPQDEALPIKVLHNPNGMALKYADGEGLYALNGILIPQDLTWVCDPAARTYKKVLDIKNTEIRTEALKLISPADIKKGRVLIDSWTCSVGGDYRLYEIDYGSEVKRVYLEMTCPSKKEMHFEAVPPQARTCQQALNWRTYETFDDVYVPPIERT